MAAEQVAAPTKTSIFATTTSEVQGLGRLVLSCMRARRQIDIFFLRFWGCLAADLSITVSKL